MQHDSVEHAVHLNGFVLDARHGELRNVVGARVALRAQAMAVLQCLAHNANRVVGKDELMQTVWRGVAVTDDSLVQCIKELRRALGDDLHRVIETEPKRGYRLVPAAAAAAPMTTPTTARFEQDIRFATSADGTRIAYASSGDGPAMVRAAGCRHAGGRRGPAPQDGRI
jgi:DNA-binding winged helix-turn-helix (wHTH) protein